MAELIKQRFRTATALAAKIDMELSPFSRGVKSGTLNLVNLLKLAKAADEQPSIVLRLAGKGEEADLIEEVYGSGDGALTVSEREMLDAWNALTPRAREGLRLTLSELPRSQVKQRLVTEAPHQAAQKKGRRSRG